MTKLLEDAVSKVLVLPEEDQDAIAAIVLQEIESEARWNELFSHAKSADMLAKLADQAIAQARAGRARKLDLNDL